MDMWQILYIPDKAPVPPDQQPTVNVIASTIEPELTNTIIRRLNQIVALENLRHVKRVKKSVQGGKTQLSVILCLAGENDNQMSNIPPGVQELINSYQLSPFITKVCKYAALSKEEWEEQCKLWPTSYHPPTYNIDGITGFNEEDSQSVFRFMKFAIELAKSGDGSIVNAAVIVDPSVRQVIASGCDQICSCHGFTKGNSIESCSKQAEDYNFHPDYNGLASHMTLHSNGSPNETRRSYTGISCLNPWQWSQQKPHDSSCNWHPLRHATLVAIESSAARDRHIYPGSAQDVDKSNEVDNTQPSSAEAPAKRQKTDLANVENGEEVDGNSKISQSASARPYLCTGYDIFLVWEPCIMCAMALVHQRIRRIFYAFLNHNTGALGSVHRLQGEKSLNHHYAVFRVSLPEEILDMDETVAARIAKADTTTTIVCQQDTFESGYGKR